jgi:hypothetical protein
MLQNGGRLDGLSRTEEIEMRYFLDAEFNGFCGDLISIALVPENDKVALFYQAIACPEPTSWVALNVIPVLHITPLSRAEVANRFAIYLLNDPNPLLVADWPEDIAHAARLLVTGPGRMKPIRQIRFELVDPSLLGLNVESAMPHNARDDAASLRLRVLEYERRYAG